MRRFAPFFLYFLLYPCLPLKAWSGYYIEGGQSQSWDSLLTALGYRAVGPDMASLIVIRPGASATETDWRSKVQLGTFLIVEGNSPIAHDFGFLTTGESAPVAREHYETDPSLLVLWQQPQTLPIYQMPSQAKIYSVERWSGAPLLAGYRMGAGAVIWAAVDPGVSGYDRLPYLAQALQDLGLTLPFQSRHLWLFFDYAYRTRVNLNYMAARWRAMGVAGLWVSTWYFIERDPVRDDYLRRLILACHQNGIMVYAWLELPHVSEQFWNDHPQWREKTALLQDAAIYWRKNMNLLNRECFHAAAEQIRALLSGFDWDGVNLSELYFEGPAGVDYLPEFTPFNDDVRREVRDRFGFDPIDLFIESSPVYYLKNSDALAKFEQYRVELEYRLHIEWIEELLRIREARPGFALTITYIDDLFDHSFRKNVGADTASMLRLLDSYDFDFVGEDPSILWSLGPERYSEISRLYGQLTDNTERLGIDINIVKRLTLSFPTRIQTGSEVARLLHTASSDFKKVGLYFDASILPADQPLLPASSAAVNKFEVAGNKTTVSSPYGVGLAHSSAALVDGKLWPFADDGVVWLPAGEHTVEPSAGQVPIRLLDFNGMLVDASLKNGVLQFRYSGNSRALAVIDREPNVILVNGSQVHLPVSQYKGRYSMILPPGENSVEIVPFPAAGKPFINPGAIVNTATFSPNQPLAPGSMASLFGNRLASKTAMATGTPLPTQLGEASVSINGASAPLFFVSPNRIDFQVPWEVAGFSQVPVTVTVVGVTSDAQTVRIGPFGPGIFGYRISKYFVPTNRQDTFYNSSRNPLIRAVQHGDTVEISCTGLGSVSNTPITGVAALGTPQSLVLGTPTVTIGGVPARVTFSGLAPGFVGLYQVNVTIPAEVSPGMRVPVVLTIGGISSNTVLLAVQ